jgi:type IV pilus assembly protein PilM
MFSRKTTGFVVGLDLGADSVAAVAASGSNGSTKVERTAIAPLEPGLVAEGEVVDPVGLTTALRELFAEHRLSKTVRLGLANQRLTMRTIRLPLIEDAKELDTAVRFQAQEVIPMPLDQAVLDYQVTAQGRADTGERWMEVAAVAGRRDMLSVAVETLREAGLKPVGIDLSAFGLLRALPSAPVEDDPATAALYCNFGDVTNLAVGHGGSCLFTRVAAFGYEEIVARVAERCAMPAGDARALLADVRLDSPEEPAATVAPSPEYGAPPAEADAERVVGVGPAPEMEEGEPRRVARDALADGVAKLANEIRLSLEAYGAQEGAAAVDRLVLTGVGCTIDGLPERLQQSLGYAVEVQLPAALANLPDTEAARLTVPYGLALEE